MNDRSRIDIREDEKIDTRALKALIRAAVALNVVGKAKKPKKTATAKKKKKKKAR